MRETSPRGLIRAIARARLSLMGPALLCARHGLAADESCADLLRIEATPVDAAELRDALEKGLLGRESVEPCRAARVEFEAKGSGWRVAVSIGPDQVERQVASLDDAAAWIESWLLPTLGSEPNAAPTKNEKAVAQPVAKPSAAPASPATRAVANRERPSAVQTPTAAAMPAGTVILLAFADYADDRSVWGGTELSGELALGRRIWVGAGVGWAQDPLFGGDSQVGDDTHRSLVRASLRAGATWPLTTRLRLDAGLGVGLLTAVVVRSETSGQTSDDAGATLGEVFATAQLDLGARWSLAAGLATIGVLGLETEDGSDAPAGTVPLPPAHPAVFGSLRVGAAWRFGDVD
jgi:hypothetical protein